MCDSWSYTFTKPKCAHTKSLTKDSTPSLPLFSDTPIWGVRTSLLRLKICSRFYNLPWKICSGLTWTKILWLFCVLQSMIRFCFLTLLWNTEFYCANVFDYEFFLSWQNTTAWLCQGKFLTIFTTLLFTYRWLFTSFRCTSYENPMSRVWLAALSSSFDTN